MQIEQTDWFYHIDSFLVAVFFDVVAGFASGLTVGATETAQKKCFIDGSDPCDSPTAVPLLFFEGASFASSLFSLNAAGVERGDPDMGTLRMCYHMIVFLWMTLLQLLLLHWYGFNLRVTKEGYWKDIEGLNASYPYFSYFAWILIWFSMVLGLRGPAMPLSSFVGLAAGTAICIAMSLKLNYFWWPGTFIKYNLIILLSYRTPYLRDQRLASCIMSPPILAYMLGWTWELYESGECIQECAVWRFGLPLLFLFIAIYGNLLLRRTMRCLPPGLDKAKFVRIGYLRHLKRSGGQICRCQDLPPQAFGDVEKATHLVVVSHRWFDPYECDLLTSDFPQGVKLHNLYKRLARHFLVSPNTRVSAATWHNALCIGGWDVLIFFDFMSIPQRLRKADGSVIERTAEEQAIFNTCLPQMGTLYSAFPVLILDEVQSGDVTHRYFDSGWCTCEFKISMLGKTLSPYSEDQKFHLASVSQADLTSHKMNDDRSLQFERRVRKEIESKHFLHDSDRKVALGIIHSFVVNRLLFDAIKLNDMEAFRRHLEGLKQKGLLAALTEPLDRHLNTIPHMAVRRRRTAAVKELLRYGVDCNMRNLFGDTPGQFFLFRRLGTAARICRNAKTPTEDVGDAQIIGTQDGSLHEGQVSVDVGSDGTPEIESEQECLHKVARERVPSAVGTGIPLEAECQEKPLEDDDNILFSKLAL